MSSYLEAVTSNFANLTTMLKQVSKDYPDAHMLTKVISDVKKSHSEFLLFYAEAIQNERKDSNSSEIPAKTWHDYQ